MKKILLGIFFLITFFSCESEPKNIKINGPVFGTTYNIQYYSGDDENFKKQFDELFKSVNESMSTYIADSKISLENKKFGSNDIEFILSILSL